MLLGKDVQKTYRETKAVQGVTIQIAQGETAGLVGESGCGKSTLARMLCGLTTPDAGTVSLDGTVFLKKMQFWKRVQIVFQDSSGSLDPRLKIYKTLEEPITNYASYSQTEKQKQIHKLLESVHLSYDVSRKYPHELSGGQRQRVVIARALAVNPDYLLCDEPLSGLDGDTQEHILDLLTSLKKERRLGCLFISHDLGLCTRVSRSLYVMFAGRIVERLSSEAVRSAVHPYTRSLFEYLSEADAGRGKTGTDFGIADRGCAFRLQCPQSAPQCREEPPEIFLDTGHWVRCHYPGYKDGIC